MASPPSSPGASGYPPTLGQSSASPGVDRTRLSAAVGHSAASTAASGAAGGAGGAVGSGAAGSPGGGAAVGSPGGSGAARGSARWSSARTSVLAYRGLSGLNASYFLEKQAVVLDFGAALTKIGFATESKPRHILPTPELQLRGSTSSSGFTKPPAEYEWIDILDRLLNKVFFHYLSVSPKDRRIVICDQAHSTAQFRSALAFVLFKRLSVPSIAFVADLVLPLYLTGLSSGVVIDLGYRCTRVLVTFAGVPLLSALRTAAPGGRLIVARLKAELLKALDPKAAAAAAAWVEDFHALQDLATAVCYARFATHGGPPDPAHVGQPVLFAPPQGDAVAVPAACRWRPCEALFAMEDGDRRRGVDADPECCPCRTVQEAFLQAVEACPIDVRPAVVQNVVVVGGCATIRGVLPRLAVELQGALKRGERTAAMAAMLRFTPLDFPPVCATWTGGAVFGALEGIRDYTAADYEAGRLLPDWLRDGFV